MGCTARHRGGRTGRRRPLDGTAPRRRGAAVVGSLVVASMLGYSSHPAPGLDRAAGATSSQVGAVRTAMAASVPVVSLQAAAASVTTPEHTAATAVDGDHIPAPAHAAYQRAASVMGEVAPACDLSWTLLAAIGRVESDHGRYGGAVLGSDGVPRPHIVGVALDGTGSVAEIHDTDGGSLDGDVVWDRAVGPMQFLPATWSLAGVDGDGDAVRNPHDLDDAALAAGVYLCAGGGDLSLAADVRAALYRYNRSASYVALVMAYEQRYRTGRFTVGAGAALPTTILAAAQPDAAPKVDRDDRPAGTGSVRPPATEETTSPPGPRPAQPARDPARDPADDPTSSPDRDGTGADAAPAPYPHPSPGPEPTPDPDPGPTPTEPDGGAAEPVDPDRETSAGVWTACDGGYCLDGNPLLLGDPELLDEPAAEDYDGDGEAETYAAELAGLVGSDVVLVVDKQDTGWTVFSINGLDLAPASVQPTTPGEPVE